MARVLCVDDDQYLTDLLRYALSREGFEVLMAHTGRDALRLLRSESLDLVILDVNIPDMNGFKVLSSLRAFTQVPVVMLTARAQDDDVIAGFGQGADDYVAKPFSVQVLMNRIKAVLRRAKPQPEKLPPGGAHYRIHGNIFDAELNEIVAPDQTRVKLTPTESRILHLLYLHEGQVLSAERIMDRIWGYDTDSDVNVIKTHIRHLREKIGSLPNHPQPIRTLPGVGYVVNQTDEDGRVVTSDAAFQE
ncbi:MAG TPA: response regulator transcription factor [Chloroflexota bacterium]|nr:response regulator transcription factor [Chloroflexota bacterium]